MRSVWFIRHAQSEANSGLPTDNPDQISITPYGEKQAHYLAKVIVEPPALIVTSPYLRTKQTAKPTFERFPTVRHEEWPIQEFTYLEPSRYVGTTASQRRPMAAAYWEQADPDYADGDGAESFVALMARIQWALTRIKSGTEPFTILFGHGLFTRSLLWYVLSDLQTFSSASMKQCRAFCESFACPNGSIMKTQLSVGNDLYFSPFITTHLPAN